MVCEKFPMSSGEEIEIKTEEEFFYNIDNYCCVFEVRFTDFHSKVMFDNPISASKCHNLVNDVLNNGRIVSADSFTITMTNIDYRVYEMFYTWEKMEIGTFYRYKADYLPTEFVDAILTFYEDKTRLKGIIEKAVEYLHQKENVNSCYGMCVTDILRDLITFSEDEMWGVSEVDRENEIEKYNKNPQRFLFYAWGIFVTSYARANLFSGILSCGNDYIYADTDSLKILNYEKHMDYFNRYNGSARVVH